MLDFLAWLNRETRTLALLIRTQRRIAQFRHDGETTVADVFERVADARGDQPAVLFEDRALSYDDLDRQANRIAHWAREQGMKSGRCVALFMENRPDYLATWLGIAKTGAHIALINTNLTGTPLAHALSVAAPSLVIVGVELEPAYETARSALPEETPVWTFGGSEGKGRADAAISTASDRRPPTTWRRGLRTGDKLFYIYTSGTTGNPKAANFSHLRFLTVGAGYTEVAAIQPEDRIYCALPLYHTAGGVIAVSMTMMNGAALVLRRKFSASEFWSDCSKYRVTVFQYIGELCRYLLNRPEGPQDREHGVRCAVGNGLRPDVWPRFRDRFGIKDIREFYGATEGNFALVNVDNKVGAVGRIPPLLKSKFPVELIRYDVNSESHPRDAGGRCIVCAPGEPGEAIGRISVDQKQPLGQFEGYTDKAAGDKKILRDVFETGDAWYRTGDLRSRDEQGYYYFVDRIGDTFRWKGENVATSEVAEVLSVCPGVLEASVYGVKLPGAEGRVGMAALVADSKLSLDALYGHVSRQLPAYARPLFLRVRPELETTSTFKHRKVELVKEGFDPRCTDDPLYFRDDEGRQFVPVDQRLYDEIVAGRRRT